MLEYFDLETRIDNKRIDVSKRNVTKNFSIHWHDYYEIEYIISGSGTYTVDGTEYKIEPGMIFFMSPVNFHSVKTHNSKMYNVSFTGTLCSSVYLSRVAVNAFRAEDRDKIYFEAIFNELLNAKDDSSLYPLYLDCILAKLGSYSKNTDTSHSTLAQEAVLYITQNFRSRLTLDIIAAHFKFAPQYFSEIFKKQTGCTFKKYLNNIRLEYAEKLVIFSSLTVLQICSESGFDDYANFIRQFKKKFGFSPMQYRLNHQKYSYTL